MKVMALLGSPQRNGEGHRIAKMLEKELAAKGDVKVEIVHLADIDLMPCRGCFNCIAKGKDKCPLKDSRAELERRMLAADGLILISPGYVQNVSGLMKNFIDRFSYTNHRPEFFHQSTIIVANGGAGLKHVLRALRIALGGARVVYELQVISPPWPINDKMRSKNERGISRAADALFLDMKNKGSSPIPSFGEYMRFRFFKAISPGMERYLPADHEYYGSKGEYHYDVKIGLGNRAAAAVLLRIGLFASRGMGPAEQVGEAITDDVKGQ